MKIFVAYIIILHICIKNHNHTMFGSWDTEWDRQKNFLILGHFLPFYLPLIIPNIKILKKRKKCLEILSFYTYMCTINEDHMIYGSWNMVQQTEIFDIFGPFLPIQPLENLENGHITTLHICTINNNHMMYRSWDMECDRHNFLSFWTVFWSFTLLWTQKIKLFKKMEKTPEDIIILQT